MDELAKKLLGTTSNVSFEQKGLSKALAYLSLFLRDPNDPSFTEKSSISSDYAKLASALYILFVNASRKDFSESQLSKELSALNFPALTEKHIQSIEDCYRHMLPTLREQLSLSSHYYPKIVDTRWKLNLVSEASSPEKFVEYTIILDLQVPFSGKIICYEFCCSENELQELLGKVKEACMAAERFKMS